MLGVGEKFPEFQLKATVSTDLKNAFKDINNDTYEGKWKVYFFWPKDFTFVCPTEIAAFGRLNREFQDRDTQVLGGSTDSEFVHLAWRQHHQDLKDLPFQLDSGRSQFLKACGDNDDPSNAGIRAFLHESRHRSGGGDDHRKIYL